MDEFKIPKIERAARILLDDGRILDGRFYLSPSGPDGRPETMTAYLNDASKEFVPFACDEDGFLLNKSGILTVTVPDPEREIHDEDRSGEHRVAVRVSLAGGTSLLGELAIVARPERSRVLDYLNAASRFVPLFGGSQLTLVQKRFIVSVRATRD